MPLIARALPNECASKGLESTPQKRWLRKEPDRRASWYRLCDSHGEIATQVSGGMPVNEKVSLLESDNVDIRISGLDQAGRLECSAVHLDKRDAILPTAPVVNRPRDQFIVPLA
jgi:hypothetical protein